MSVKTLKIESEYHQARLDVFLTRMLTDMPSRTFVKRLIEDGHVKVNESVVKPNYKISEGEDVLVNVPDDFLTPAYIGPENIPLDIVYEDDYLIVVNKASGMLVHPTTTRSTGTLVNALLHYSVKLSDFNTDMRPGIVHRLDQETSGVILIAKDNITHTKLAKQFKRHEVKKHYVALVEGRIEFDEGKIDAPLGRHPQHREKKAVRYEGEARDALTYYRVIKRTKDVTLVDLFPKTGRTHQLRVHMKHLGHPILGDAKYGKKRTFSRLALHAQSIQFRHPQTKDIVEFSTPSPKSFGAKVGL